ncbi:hypothetical protein [Paraferrimonas sedimenticola]|uniref:ATPase n=1 Tax=Paraferrimonas sedimenticola TaxID=375674 RepID=A0AA37RVS0_9GAMM|nr:hypothetical protein [Paraferrimonas sedimenticola]GLP95747.1 hypothetical protein GCM10007895_10530 [Paraferrimonas sedimenticola]
MRIQQLQELIEYVASCRQDMAKLYQRLAQQADSSRVTLMLEYLVTHEKEVAEKLLDYVADAPDTVLQSWLRDFNFEDFAGNLDKIQIAADFSEDQVLDLHLKLENKLIGLLEENAKRLSTKDAVQAVEALVAVEQNRQKRLVHSTMRMDDI